MNDPPPPQVIVQIANAGRVECDGYYDLPLPMPAYIALVTDGTAVAQAEAAGLRSELRRQITSLPGARLELSVLPCGHYRDNFDCNAINRHYSRNVLVFVGADGGGPAPGPAVVPAQRMEILTILAPGSAVPALPWGLPTTNAGYWVSHAADFVPRILAAAGLTSPESRVFISYRRDEAGPIAEQLFGASCRGRSGADALAGHREQRALIRRRADAAGGACHAGRADLMDEWQPSERRLAGMRVVVLARVPRAERATSDRPTTPVLEAEEAIVSVVRALLIEGCAVTVVGDPSLALLATVVGGEYAEPRLDEEKRPPLVSVRVIGRSESRGKPSARVDEPGDETSPLIRLAELGLADLRFTQSDLGALADESSNAAALLCVGRCMQEDVSTFRKANERAPILVFADTFESDARGNLRELEGIERIDETVEREAPLPEQKVDLLAGFEPEYSLPPIALSAQRIVERLVDRPRERARNR